jgi:hypothetical protein
MQHRYALIFALLMVMVTATQCDYERLRTSSTLHDLQLPVQDDFITRVYEYNDDSTTPKVLVLTENNIVYVVNYKSEVQRIVRLPGDIPSKHLLLENTKLYTIVKLNTGELKWLKLDLSDFSKSYYPLDLAQKYNLENCIVMSDYIIAPTNDTHLSLIDALDNFNVVDIIALPLERVNLKKILTTERVISFVTFDSHSIISYKILKSKFVWMSSIRITQDLSTHAIAYGDLFIWYSQYHLISVNITSAVVTGS